jgi:putative Holliday junction resolvase
MARLLGIDPGSKRCGVAVTDRDESMAFPRPALATNDLLVESLRSLVEDQSVELVVIGQEADALYALLVDGLAPIPVVQWDERLTTHEAQRSLSEAGVKAKNHREHVDSAAAVIMLQSYVDGRRAQ